MLNFLTSFELNYVVSLKVQRFEFSKQILGVRSLVAITGMCTMRLEPFDEVGYVENVIWKTNFRDVYHLLEEIIIC